MSQSPRRKWTHDEAAQALVLYFQIPFGQIRHQDPRVKELARRIGRSDSSVSLKLANFASLDPDHIARGVKGMANTSKLDRQIWDQYYGNWESLSDFDFDNNDDGAMAKPKPINTDSTAIIKTRRGQSFFRKTVLAAHDNRCCITGIATVELLRASHIVPWMASKPNRLDPRNGLTLNALHDAAFDRGFLTLDECFRVKYSPLLKTSIPGHVYDLYFGRHEGKTITLPGRFVPDSSFLDFHRRNVFRN